MIEKAIAEVRRACETSRGHSGMDAFLAYIYAVAGKRAEAENLLQDIQGRREAYVSPWDVALVYVGLGENDLAFEWLAKAAEERAGWLVYLKTFPKFDPFALRSSFCEAVASCRV